MRDPLAGALMVCRGCGAGNGRDRQHCAKCGASLRDAVPIRGAGDFDNDAGRAWHQALVQRHRRWSVAAVMAMIVLANMVAGAVSLTGWRGILAQGALALAVTGLAIWRRWGHLPLLLLGGGGVCALWMWTAECHPHDSKPAVIAACWLPVQLYLYWWAGTSLRHTSDLTDG